MMADAFSRLVRKARRRRGSTWWDAMCPAHNDRPSLSFRDGDRGLILHCHAGCPKPEILDHLGLGLRDLFHNNGTQSRPIAATYSYHDENGELLHQVVRFKPKSFATRRPDGHGGWVWDMRGVRRVLYRLPALLGRELVFVVEGEKDADALVTVGLAATTCPWGAGSWRDEYAYQLRYIVVLPDNDEAGHEFAHAIKESCVSVGLTVQIVDLPGLPPKGDVSDWLAAGHGRDDVLNLVGRLDGVAP